jgi:hypothetical protein
MNGFLNIPWVVWGGLALVVALLFVFFVPGAKKINATTGFQRIIVRWFHSLCWLLLAINFFLRAIGTDGANGVANLVAAAGGIAYALYMVNFMQVINR